MKDKAQNVACVILAAGKGTRMRSNLPKVMHKVAGRAMLHNVIDTALSCNAQKLVVVTSPDMGPVRSEVGARYGNRVSNVVQERQLGTGDAVKAAEHALAGHVGNVIVLYGDTPLITRETVLAMSAALDVSGKTAVAVLGMEVPVPNAYGRLVVDRKGRIDRIVEARDASPKEKAIATCNSGVMAIRGNLLFTLLARLDNKNAGGEFYLTDLVALARKEKHDCVMVTASDPEELLGVNSRVELAVAEGIMQRRLRKRAMEGGVTMIDPDTVYLSQDTRFGSDVIIQPDVVFGPGVEVGDGVEIRSFCHIEGARIHTEAVIGPFARIRPGSDIGDNAHIGNFVEIKKARVGRGSKVNHLSYVGDAEVGERTNIGAGTITCNYDGYSKYRTDIGSGAFIGSNTSLVAPVKVGDGAIIAAGSVITRDVPGDSLAIARSRQEDKPGWAKNFRDKK